MQNSEYIIFTAGNSGKRLDGFLADHFAGTENANSRSYFSNIIEDGFVLINGRKAKKSDKVSQGDELSVYFPKPDEPDLTPAKIDFDILYETDRYAVINKPAGVTVHHAPGNNENTLVNGLLYSFDIKDDDELRPGIVHRLDKDTSGVILVAKDSEAREIFSALFKERQVIKKYYAVALGKPAFTQKSVNAPIGRDKKNRQKMAMVDDGKEALTDITVIQHLKGAFLADVLLHTGRTHQIRVHMRHIGHPLLGDPVYGIKACAVFPRQALHSYFIGFTDPFTQKKVEVTAPLPDDIEGLIDSLSSE